jgi:Ran GTPase-activating protein (RanGAP) involved in mRNA processing and transport
MRRKRDSERSEKAGSNLQERKRMGFLREVYMDNKGLIEARFLASMGGDNIPMKEKLLIIRAFREGAVEILDAVERTFGIGGVHDVSHRIKTQRQAAPDAEGSDEADDEEECDDEGGDGYERTPVDDTPWTYEKVDPRGVEPWEHLRGMPRFPLELVDKEEEPSGPEPEDEEEDEDEDEEVELDIIERVVDWENVRGLWKDFDPAYR